MILYELLTGRRPFEGPITAVLGMIPYAEPAPPSIHRPDLDPALESIVLKAIAKKPEDRYSSMDEFAEALTAFLSEEVAPVAVSPQHSEKQAAQIFADVVGREPTSLRGGKPPGEPLLGASENGSPRSRGPILTGVVAVAVLSVLLLFGIVYVATDKGRIKIEVNDPAAVVYVDGEEVRIEGLGEPITLRTGEHELSVKRDDGESQTRNFVIRRGDNRALKVVLAPIPPKAVPPSGDPPTPVVVKADPPPSPPTESRNVEKADSFPQTDKKDEPPPSPISTAESRKAEGAKLTETPGMPVETAPPAQARVPATVDVSLITNSIGMKLRLVPDGEFQMGAPDGEPEASNDEKPRHRVRITRPFYLGVYEVTQAEYREVMGKNPSYFSAEGVGKAKVAGLDTSRHPVEAVSWQDAMAFCNKLSERERLRPCYRPDGGRIESGEGYRLPTEAEWEYACRAGTTTAFAFGESLSPTMANFNGNYVYNGSSKGANLERTEQVGRYAPNRFGLHDMHGNVWEWCEDNYDEKYYRKLIVDDPGGRSEAAVRVVRSGGWASDPQDCRSAKRLWFSPVYQGGIVGFRVARVRSGL